MWNCHKCGKPVYFAERKQSLGYDWHPECLRCEECAKRLNPGQHAEHKGVPYCHVPCYGALFGPQLFGHGTRVESHTSFGKVENKSAGPNMARHDVNPQPSQMLVDMSHLESKLKQFNQYYDGRSGEVRSREVNGRLVLEGALRIHWGVLGVIHLKEDDDQRTVVTIRKRNSCRSSVFNVKTEDVHVDVERVPGRGAEAASDASDSSDASTPDDSAIDLPSPTASTDAESNSALSCVSCDSGVGVGGGGGGSGGGGAGIGVGGGCSLTLPSRLDIRQIDWDELDELLQVERKTEDGQKAYSTMPAGVAVTSWPLTETPPPSPHSPPSPPPSPPLAPPDADAYSQSFEDDLEDQEEADRSPGPVEQAAQTDDGRRRSGSTAIKRRAGGRRNRKAKLKRRCSINGHFYNRETSFFTPPFGSQMSVWVTSLVTSQEVINLLLDKYKVDSRPNAFALFVVRDNGEQRRLADDEYPLLVRVMLGPHEDVAKIYLMDGHSTDDVSFEVAQFLNLSAAECSSILDLFYAEEEREVRRVRAKFREMKRRIKQRMEELKVRL